MAFLNEVSYRHSRRNPRKDLFESFNFDEDADDEIQNLIGHSLTDKFFYTTLEKMDADFMEDPKSTATAALAISGFFNDYVNEGSEWFPILVTGDSVRNIYVKYGEDRKGVKFEGIPYKVSYEDFRKIIYDVWEKVIEHYPYAKNSVEVKQRLSEISLKESFDFSGEGEDIMAEFDKTKISNVVFYHYFDNMMSHCMTNMDFEGDVDSLIYCFFFYANSKKKVFSFDRLTLRHPESFEVDVRFREKDGGSVSVGTVEVPRLCKLRDAQKWLKEVWDVWTSYPKAWEEVERAYEDLAMNESFSFDDETSSDYFEVHKKKMDLIYSALEETIQMMRWTLEERKTDKGCLPVFVNKFLKNISERIDGRILLACNEFNVYIDATPIEISKIPMIGTAEDLNKEIQKIIPILMQSSELDKAIREHIEER